MHHRSEGGGASEYGSSADGDLEGFAEALALPEESESPFYNNRAAPRGYQGPPPAFNMPPDLPSPNGKAHSAHFGAVAHAHSGAANGGGSPAASAAAHSASFAVDAKLCDAGQRPARGFTPFPGMIGPRWESSGDGGAADFIPPHRPQEAAVGAQSNAGGGATPAATPLGMGLGLGAFGLGGSMWGAPLQQDAAGGSWGSPLAGAAGGNGAADDKNEAADGIGRAALAKLWE